MDYAKRGCPRGLRDAGGASDRRRPGWVLDPPALHQRPRRRIRPQAPLPAYTGDARVFSNQYGRMATALRVLFAMRKHLARCISQTQNEIGRHRRNADPAANSVSAEIG